MSLSIICKFDYIYLNKALDIITLVFNTLTESLKEDKKLTLKLFQDYVKSHPELSKYSAFESKFRLHSSFYM